MENNNIMKYVTIREAELAFEHGYSLYLNEKEYQFSRDEGLQEWDSSIRRWLNQSSQSYCWLLTQQLQMTDIDFIQLKGINTHE